MRGRYERDTELTLPSELFGVGMLGIAALASRTCSTMSSGSSSSGYSMASRCLRSGDVMPSMFSEEAGVVGLKKEMGC